MTEKKTTHDLVIEKDKNSSFILSKFLSKIKFNDIGGPLSLRKRTKDDDLLIDGFIEEEEEEPVKKKKFKREIKVDLKDDWILEDKNESGSIQAPKKYLGTEEFEGGTSPYVLFIEDDGKFYAIPISPKWFSFKPIIHKNMADNFSAINIKGDPTNKANTSMIEKKLNVPKRESNKNRFENIPINVATKMRVKEENEVEEELRKIQEEDDYAEKEYNIDYDIENMFEDDEGTIKSYKEDKLHAIPEMPKGYGQLNEIDNIDDEDEVDGEVDWEAREKKKILDAVRLKRKRERGKGGEGGPPTKKVKTEGEANLSIEKIVTQATLEEVKKKTVVVDKKKSRFERLKGKVLRFMKERGDVGVTVKDLLKHTKIVATKEKQNEDYQHLALILKRFCERKKIDGKSILFLKQNEEE